MWNFVKVKCFTLEIIISISYQSYTVTLSVLKTRGVEGQPLKELS